MRKTTKTSKGEYAQDTEGTLSIKIPNDLEVLEPLKIDGSVAKKFPKTKESVDLYNDKIESFTQTIGTIISAYSKKDSVTSEVLKQMPAAVTELQELKDKLKKEVNANAQRIDQLKNSKPKTLRERRENNKNIYNLKKTNKQLSSQIDKIKSNIRIGKDVLLSTIGVMTIRNLNNFINYFIAVMTEVRELLLAVIEEQKRSINGEFVFAASNPLRLKKITNILNGTKDKTQIEFILIKLRTIAEKHPRFDANKEYDDTVMGTADSTAKNIDAIYKDLLTPDPKSRGLSFFRKQFKIIKGYVENYQSVVKNKLQTLYGESENSQAKIACLSKAANFYLMYLLITKHDFITKMDTAIRDLNSVHYLRLWGGLAVAGLILLVLSVAIFISLGVVLFSVPFGAVGAMLVLSALFPLFAGGFYIGAGTSLLGASVAGGKQIYKKSTEHLGENLAKGELDK